MTKKILLFFIRVKVSLIDYAPVFFSKAGVCVFSSTLSDFLTSGLLDSLIDSLIDLIISSNFFVVGDKLSANLTSRVCYNFFLILRAPFSFCCSANSRKLFRSCSVTLGKTLIPSI